jgi:hypothetical protein
MPQLVVHPVDVGRERTQLVAVADVNMPGKVAGGDRREARTDPLDWSD